MSFKWPAFIELKKLLTGEEALSEVGYGSEIRSEKSNTLHARIRGAEKVASVCPYCAVGCGTTVFVRDNKIVHIEGNADSPINDGTLCPKGSAIYELTVNPHRLTKMLYRRPGGTEWEEVSVEWAMERIAQLVKETRDKTMQLWADEAKTVPLRQCTGIASLGGACLDNEENYMIKKLFTGGLGMVWVENQARI
jgi:formate dehydrogenase major subunit